MKVGEFSEVLKKYGLKALRISEKESIWETFKINTNLEDNPD